MRPRKKAGPVPGTPAPEKISCPACKSEISGDGATLHARSKQLEEWIEDAGAVEKTEKVIESLEAKLAAEKQENQELKAKLEGATKSKTGEKTNEVVGTGEAKPKRGSWW